MLAALSATSLVFSGGRTMYGGLSSATFFEFVLILATGLQTAFIGACGSFIFRGKLKGQ